MRSALYYPDIEIADTDLVKMGLLLWDHLEYIVPWKPFGVPHQDRHIAEAMELIGKQHVPASDEQSKAHKRLEEELVNGPLPPQFYLNSVRRRARADKENKLYLMYKEKLLPESWELLSKARIAGELRGDYPLTEYAGLAVMSILAECCAGTTRSRVTDRSTAFATVARLLGNNSPPTEFKKGEAYGQLVPISLSVINVSKIDIAKLINLRRREVLESGHTLSDLRRRYVSALEGYVNQLSNVEETLSDAQERQRLFKSDMERDLKELKAELGFARTELLTSKKLIVTVLTGVATATSWFAGLHLQLEGVITMGGAPVAVGGLVGLRSKYAKARKAAMEKHPMAYLYAAKRAKLLK
jgi:hypothetical protein